MLKIIKIIFGFLLLFGITNLFAGDSNSTEKIDPLKTNGCGSGWNAVLVPESSPITGCDFHKSCDAHDTCYGKCEGKRFDPSNPNCEYLRCRKDGDLFQSQICYTDVKLTLLLTKAENRKLSCDKSLFGDIVRNNIGKPVCKVYAWLYQHAVKKWGDGSFVGVDPTGKIVNQKESEYNSAISKFITNGTAEQFQEFSDAIDNNSIKVDMTDPIFFDSINGLQNKN